MDKNNVAADAARAMICVAGCGYVNALSAAKLGLRGHPAYERSEPEDATTPAPARKQRLKPANDDTPVFEVAEAARNLQRLEPATPDWRAPRMSSPRGVSAFRFGFDGPSDDHRIRAGSAWYTSNRYRGQHANDNQDWPLAKLLKAEGADHHLALAERYRGLWEVATMPHDLVGREIDNDLYVLGDRRLDASTGSFIDKGVKSVTGKKARLDTPATRAVVADPGRTKKHAKPVPRSWTGDWPLLHRIDCHGELEAVHQALGLLREAFEAAVCHGETLEAIGRKHHVGNQAGAKGAGRALVMLGMRAVDEFWQRQARNPRHLRSVKAFPDWMPGDPVPGGYYRSTMYPDAIFRKAA